MNKQRGFTLIEGLIITLIIGVVGFAGYVVLNNSQEEETEVIETAQQDPVSQETEEPSESTEKPPTNPETWIDYTNKELGISYSYPQEWGDVVDKDFSGNGNSNYYEFSDVAGYFGLGGQQTDYESGGRGGSLIDYGGFISDGGVLSLRNYDGSTVTYDQSLTDGYKLNKNGTCIYSTTVIHFQENAYHATCNLNNNDIYGYNFAAYDEPSSVLAEDFINVIESVKIN